MKSTNASKRVFALLTAFALTAAFAFNPAVLPSAQAEDEDVVPLNVTGFSVGIVSETVPAAGGSVSIPFTVTAEASPSSMVTVTVSSGGTAMAPVIVTVDSDTPTIYNNSITVTIPANTGIAKTVPVTLTVSPGGLMDTAVVSQAASPPLLAITGITGPAQPPAALNHTSQNVSLSFTVTTNVAGTVNLNCTSSQPSWATVTATHSAVTAGASPSGTAAVTVTLAANTTGAARNAVITLSGGGSSATVTVTQNGDGLPAPILSSNTVSPGGTLNVTNRPSDARVEVWSRADHIGYKLADSSTSAVAIPNATNINGEWYIFFERLGVYSPHTVFTVGNIPARPVVTFGQSLPAGGQLAISSYTPASNLTFYVGVNNNTTSLTNLIAATHTNGTTVTLPASLTKTGEHWLYVYNTTSQQLSEASLNSFNVTNAGKPVRPVIEIGQSVRQGGALRITSYNLPSGSQFAVRATNSTAYHVSTTTGSSVTTVTLPATLAEGTYQLFVRLAADTSVMSDASANTFIVDNTQPALVSTTPSHNSSNISPLTTFSITFSERMDTTKGTTVVRNNASGGRSPAITNTTWSSDGRTVTYTLSDMLANTSYTATIYNADASGVSAYRDQAGNLLRSAAAVSFQTGDASTVAGATSTVPISANVATAGGVTTAAIDSDTLANAATKAADDERWGYNAVIELSFDMPASAAEARVTFPSAALSNLLGKTKASLKIGAGGLAAVTLDTEALSAINQSGGGAVTIGILKHSVGTLNAAQYAAIGSDPAYELTATVGTYPVTSFGGGQALVSVPYPLSAAGAANQVAGYKVSPAGVRTLAMGRLNHNTGTFDFRLNGFSTYTVKYSPKGYTDVLRSDWFFDAVEYTSARGLLDVFTTGAALEPGRQITRAEFTVVFMQAYGIAPDPNAAAVPFADVPASSPYYDYLRTGKAMGIIQGKGDNLFDPNGPVPREQFFQLTFNILTAMKRMPPRTSANTVYNYLDFAKIGAYYVPAIDELTRAGAIQGENGNIVPDRLVMRREMAQLIYNFIT